MTNRTTKATKKVTPKRPSYYFYHEALAAHIRLVASNLQAMIASLALRAAVHDASKWGSQEFDAYKTNWPTFRYAPYGTPEHRAALAAVDPAIRHHYGANDHHPEHHDPNPKQGIRHMTLPMLVEMFCDWKAASERTEGDTLKLDMMQERFGFSDELLAIFKNTARAFEEGTL